MTLDLDPEETQALEDLLAEEVDWASIVYPLFRVLTKLRAAR